MASPPPSERIFVSGLPATVDDQKIKEVFGAYGSLTDCKVLTGKGAAILTFGSVDEATWIVENLDGNMPEGIPSPIGVKFANPQNSWGKGGKGGGWAKDGQGPYGKGGGGGGSWGGMEGGKGGSIQGLKRAVANMLPGGVKGSAKTELFVKGLPADTSDKDLAEIFSPFGAIPPKGVKAMLGPDGQCSGVGFVDFIEESAANLAISSLNGAMTPDGTTLAVHIKNSTRKGKGGGK